MTSRLVTAALIVFAIASFARSVDPVAPQMAAGIGVTPAQAALLSMVSARPYALMQPAMGGSPADCCATCGRW